MNSQANAQNIRKVYDESFPVNVFKNPSGRDNSVNVNLSEDDLLERVYFFKYDKNGANTYFKIDCLPESERQDINGNTWILFTFKNILLFGTPEQKQKFHEFRKRYLKTLFTKMCTNQCNYEVVGSDSPSSDYDVTIYEYLDKSRNGSLNSPTLNSEDILSELSDTVNMIEREHRKVFSLSLSVLFDCNIYLTSFFVYSRERDTQFTCIPSKLPYKPYMCIPKLTGYSKEQRKWAFTKLVKVLETTDEIKAGMVVIKGYLFKFYPNYTNVYEDAKDLIQGVSTELEKYNSHDLRVSNSGNSRKKRSYDDLRKYLSVARKNSESSSTLAEDIVRKMSELSVAEKDTYSTMGSSLAHVVDQKAYPGIRDYIEVPMYIDAMIDNLGFIGQLILYQDPCYNETFMMIKISKYLDRIFTDFKCIYEKIDNTLYQNTKTKCKDAIQMVQDVSLLSERINQKRKDPALQSISELQSIVDNLNEKLRESFLQIVPTTPLFKRLMKRREPRVDPKSEFPNNVLLQNFVYIMVIVFHLASIVEDIDVFNNNNSYKEGGKRKTTRKK
jgi:hypothetical protein